MTTINYNLFLDDLRNPLGVYTYTKNEKYINKNWKIVRNYDAFCNYIEHNHKFYNIMPTIISFDHDLANFHYNHEAISNLENYEKYYNSLDEKTGYHCAKWLVEYCMNNDLDLPEFHVHSMNPIGAKKILNLLIDYEKFRNRYN